MSRPLSGLAVLLVVSCFALTSAQAQMGGSRAGIEAAEQADRLLDLPSLDPKVAVSYITLDGRAETRVRPSEIRIVLAVTAEAETAEKCQQSITATVERLKAAWSKIKIAPENIVVDFIAVLPCYGWNMEKRDKVEVGIEKRSSYRMQSNVHLAVPNGSQAEAALAQAFEQGITDIIAFDYWSRDIDEVKVKVRQEAVKAARAKAEDLLTPLFSTKPPIINVQEKTTVRYPESLYSSFRASEEAVIEDLRRNVPRIHAYRPRNTYYRGLSSDGDILPRQLPMSPEISVVSTVRLYFSSPVSGAAKEESPAAKGK
ncbi:MAG: SIMPL domain-containing protein [Thermoguttaceae bacterium]